MALSTFRTGFWHGRGELRALSQVGGGRHYDIPSYLDFTSTLIKLTVVPPDCQRVQDRSIGRQQGDMRLPCHSMRDQERFLEFTSRGKQGCWACELENKLVFPHQKGMRLPLGCVTAATLFIPTGMAVLSSVGSSIAPRLESACWGRRA